MERKTIAQRFSCGKGSKSRDERKKKWFLCVSRSLSPLVPPLTQDFIHCTNGLNIIIDLMWYHAPWLFPLSNLIILIYSTDFSWALPSNTVWVFALPAGVEDICVCFCFGLFCFCFVFLMESHTRELLDSCQSAYQVYYPVNSGCTVTVCSKKRLIVLPAHLCNDTVTLPVLQAAPNCLCC